MRYILGLLFLLCSQKSNSQKQYQIAIVAFYNLENFYDTTRNFGIDDIEFTEAGAKHYTSKMYVDKVEKLASVISKIGTDTEPKCTDGPAILGVAEIENDQVLNDLIHHPLLINRKYKLVHYDSKDARGVDVALIYNPKYFIVEKSRTIPVKIQTTENRFYYSRDILWVKGRLDGETINIYVNHWPSRVGGENRTAPARATAAEILRRHIDSINFVEGEQKVIVMGDFNDDPVSKSISEVFGSKSLLDTTNPNIFYNPWVSLYKKGLGTLANQDTWGLFDQILFSQKWLDKTQNGWLFFQPFIFTRPFITENHGRYKGYPMRTWDGNNYHGGYSDHFPVYTVLLKRIE